MIRAEIDSNVLVSGLISPAGNEALIMLAIHQGLVRPCFSEDQLARLAKHRQRRRDVVRRKREFRTRQHRSAPVLPDPDDGKFLRCVQAAGAEYIVTGNKRHFPQDACGVVRVVSAGERVDRITREI